MLINVTPHSITILAADRTVLLTLPPSGQVARCAVTRAPVGAIEVAGVTIPVSSTTFGALEGLPDPQEGVVYICSLVAHQAAVAAGRTDTVSPGELVRGEGGQPLGCLGLSR